MNDWYRQKLLPFLKNSTAPYLWLGIFVWALGAALIRLASFWPEIPALQSTLFHTAVYLVLAAITWFSRARLLGFSWYLFGILLITIWTAHIADDGLHRVLWFALLFVMLLAYFILEGVELAVTELRDKEPDVFDDPSISSAIQEINRKRSLFYDAREWIIVLLIVFLSIKSDFDNFSLPGISLGSFRQAHTIFGLLFTTFIVVWLCQSPSKELATKNSIAFLRLSGFALLWPVIRVIGHVVEQINLQKPSEAIVNGLSRLKPFHEPRDLRPSDAAYFLYGLKVFGYGLFQLKETLALEANGTAVFTQRGLLYVVSHDRNEFGRWYEFDKSFKETSRSVWAYCVPMPGEHLSQDLQDTLELAFQNPVAPSRLQKYNLLASFNQNGVPAVANGKMRRDYLIDLPINFPASQTPSSTALTALAVGFEISFTIDPGGFLLPAGPGLKVKDYLHKDVNFPWKRYELEVVLNIPDNMQFADVAGQATILKAQNTRETAKMHRDLWEQKRFLRSITYPLTGAKYIWRWEIDHN